jgi:hypothetical protein
MYGERKLLQDDRSRRKGFLLKDSDISEVRDAHTDSPKGGSYFFAELLHNVIQKIKQRI